MLKITNTFLYQTCINITTYHHKICVSTKYQHVPCIHHESTYTSTCTIKHDRNKCTNYTKYQSCTIIKHINHVNQQPITSYTNNLSQPLSRSYHNLYQQPITLISSTSQMRSHISHTNYHKCIAQTMYTYVSLIMCHTYTNIHK
jgi:hypothetical protein